MAATLSAGAVLTGCLHDGGGSEGNGNYEGGGGNNGGNGGESRKSPLPPEQRLNPAGKVVDAEALRQLVRGNTAFASDVYAELVEGDDENLLVSPYSVSVALGMTYAGAHNETAEALRDAMRYVVEGDKLHTAFVT